MHLEWVDVDIILLNVLHFQDKTISNSMKKQQRVIYYFSKDDHLTRHFKLKHV